MVINHMASCRPACDAGQPQYGNRGVGGNTYDVGQYRFNNLFDEEDRDRVSGALNAYQPEHFHHGCSQLSDWNNPWQVQNCELERLADLATEREDVQNTIANYLVTLFALGVDGLRIDAAKHFPPGDLHAILTKAATAADWTTSRVWVNRDGMWRNTCFDGNSKWMCEHRWRPIANMVGFRKAVNVNWDSVAHWWTNGHRQIAFGRGHLGFVLINAEPGMDPGMFGPEGNGRIQTGMPAGRYCDVIHSPLSPDKTRCLTENGQEVTPVTVYPDGKAHIPVHPMDAVALHVGAQLLGD